MRSTHPATLARGWRLKFILVTMLIVSLSGCDLFASSEGTSIRETQLEISVQQTIRAQEGEELSQSAQQTLEAQSATLTARAGQAGEENPTPDRSAETQQALQATQAAEKTAGAMEAAITPEPTEADFESLMQSAKILVFEDIANDTSEFAYVSKTLDAMGLDYKWDGSAKGWLKDDLVGGPPGGGAWDLVIIAVETRVSVSGEFFEYLSDVLRQGTSVIIEAWHLDKISSGAVSPILNECGVRVTNYVPRTNTINDVVVWPLAGASSHPLLSEPNAGLTFTKARSKWLASGDLGDLLHLTGSGDAQLLMGVDASESDRNGVFAVCMDGQLVLQTFSSHSFPLEVMQPLWENMITYALKVRFSQ